uniref:Peptidase S9 prolyl oligopeptidase catalytic domain-containing protein n=1 Tax=Daucus carota subsp. sativus TaxID=79200 RepID=A0A164TJG5_DAUCS
MMEGYWSLILYGIGGILATSVGLLVAFQEKLIYVPVVPGLTKSYPITPARLRLLYEDVWLRSSDGVKLHAWFIKLAPDSRGPTIVFFQENAGNIAHRLEMVRIMLQRLQCNVFMLSYRGYGASDGFPSQEGIINDSQAALDHLIQRTDIDKSRLVVFGSSKGPKVLNRFVRSPWSTIDVVGQIKQPILFLSGLRDEMVPPTHMQMLYAKAAAHNRSCQFVDFPNGMHMDTWISGGDHYWRTIQSFLEENVPEKDE